MRMAICVSMLIALTCALGCSVASAQLGWTLAPSPSWDYVDYLVIGAGTAGWGANWSKSTALASPTIIGHYTHSKANITAVGYWAVDKTCASSPDFST